MTDSAQGDIIVAPNHPDLEPTGFVLWVESGKDTQYVADQLDIPRRTVQSWVTRYHWRDKYRDLLTSLTGDALVKGQYGMSLLSHTATSRLRTLLEDDTLDPKEHRANIELWLRIVGGAGPDDQQATTHYHFTDARSIVDVASDTKVNAVTPEAMKAEAVRRLEAHSRSNTVKPNKRRGFI